MAQHLLVDQGFLIIEVWLSHSDKPHSVGLLWTSDQPDANNSTWQHSTPDRQTDRHLCPWRNSNPPSQQPRATGPPLRPRSCWDRLNLKIAIYLFLMLREMFRCMKTNLWPDLRLFRYDKRTC
jgi:hypothetical protein